GIADSGGRQVECVQLPERGQLLQNALGERIKLKVDADDRLSRGGFVARHHCAGLTQGGHCVSFARLCANSLARPVNGARGGKKAADSPKAGPMERDSRQRTHETPWRTERPGSAPRLGYLRPTRTQFWPERLSGATKFAPRARRVA